MRLSNPWTLAASNDSSKCMMPGDDQIGLLRSVLARAYEKRQPFPFRLVKAVKDYIAPRTTRKPIIESLNIIERNKDAA